MLVSFINIAPTGPLARRLIDLLHLHAGPHKLLRILALFLLVKSRLKPIQTLLQQSLLEEIRLLLLLLEAVLEKGLDLTVLFAQLLGVVLLEVGR